MLVFSAHIQVSDNVDMFSNQDSLLKRINDYLQEKYKVIESTLQVISENGTIACEPEK